MAALTNFITPGAIEEKQQKLLDGLAAMGRVIVAFSGGTDSAYLAWAANRALGGDAVAITADSASLPESHKRDAEAFVERFGIVHEYVETHEFDNPAYAQNGPTASSTSSTESTWTIWATTARVRVPRSSIKWLPR